ncbi:SDR family NAD(P)-dependent oxidoreductase [Tahibacter sp.]|uniref:SDR family NAD(P)-dependent oxidoreductase n=1 Tax=Tahibacter sp. TaxID=2056211 RepID=UPI0028C3EF6F|nr:SDR family NAD(P)-dependent oxidoreductase [Tahibacter sp.]
MDKRPQRRPLGLPALKPVDLRSAASADPHLPEICQEADASAIAAAGSPWQIIFDLSEPLLADHRVQGAHVLPGAVYVDLVYQAALNWGWPAQRIELHNLTLHHPLVVGAGERYCVRVEAAAASSPPIELQIVSLCGEGDLAPVRLATVSVAQVQPRTLAPFGHALQLLQRTPGTPIGDSYGRCESQGLEHTGIMRASGSACRVAHEIVLRLASGPAGTSRHFIDPVLVDAMGVALSPFLLEVAGEEGLLFLPLLYGRFYALSQLSATCIARVDLAGIRRSEDLIRCNVEFFSDTGQAIATLTDFTCKLVRPGQAITASTRSDGAALYRSGSAPQAVTSAPSATSLAQRVQSLVAEELGCDAAQVALDAGYYSQGLTSSSLLVIVEKLRTALGLPLAPTLFFEYTTIAALVDHLLQEYPALRKDAAAPQPSTVKGLRGQPDPPPAGTEHAGIAAAVAGGSAHSRSAVGSEQEPMAIIGMAGRFPQARNVEVFWQNLCDGKDVVTEVPDDRWHWRALQHIVLPAGRSVSRWGGFIDGVDEFDPLFFRIAPREAEAMDPQERLFLEVCWEAVENAGYVTASLGGPSRAAGVYVGCMHKDYSFVGAQALAQGDGQTPLSLNYAAIANRVSYCFDFRGPSVAIDTVCSASLTALHFACESLRLGECDVAIAGGVNLSLHPNKYISYGLMGLHSSDGRCRSFGQGGDGYVSAEAVAAVVLKPLHAARRDGDLVYAAILATGINHVGGGSGITVPDPAAQGALMLRCLDRAGVHPTSLGYIETHGTGTSLGDPIEILALSKVFSAFPAADGAVPRCALGSVKSNLGHAEAAAGITGLIKAVLQLHHRWLVPSIHCDPVNPYLALESTPFHVQRSGESWPAPQLGPRRSAVNSIGATGSNAFVLLEEAACAAPPPGDVRLPLLLPFSAHDPQRLQEYVQTVLAWLERQSATLDLAALAFTLQQGRLAMKARLCLVASTTDQVVTLLKQVLDGLTASDQIATGISASGATPQQGIAAHHDGAERVRQLVSAGAYIDLARHWCSGEAFSWQPLTPRRARRVAVPAVPRSRQRFWIGGERRPAMSPAAQAVAAPTVAHRVGTPLLLVPTWEPAAAAAAPEVGEGARLVMAGESLLARRSGLPGFVRVAVCFDETIAQLAGLLAGSGKLQSLLLLFDAPAAGLAEEIPGRLASTVMFTFRLVKALLLAGCAGGSFGLTVVTRQAVQADGDAAPDPVQAAVHGLVGVVAKEQPRWRVRVLDLATESDLQQALDSSYALPSGDAVAIRGGVALRQCLARVRFAHADAITSAYRRGGVYVIIGGAGGIGSLLTAYLGERYQAQVVWIGRRPLDPAIAAQLRELGTNGPAPVYLSADAADPGQLAAALAQATARFGAIHGLVHAAMGELDAGIAAMDEAQFNASSRPKIDICVRIAETVLPESLDFMLFFSSINAFARDHGKSGYATANTFEDAFALQFGAQAKARVKVVNWGWWADVGVSRSVPQAAIVRMERLGLAGIEPAQAMSDLEAFLRSPLRQLAVLAVSGGGHQFVSSQRELQVDFTGMQNGRVIWQLGTEADAAVQATPHYSVPSAPVASGLPPQRDDGFFEQALAVFVQLLADALKMPPSQIDPHEAMEAYGIDSILIVHMTQILERHLDQVSSTLFFEHKTLHALVRHFIDTQPDSVRALAGMAAVQPGPAAPVAVSAPPHAPVKPAAPLLTHATGADVTAVAQAGYAPIAIIGLHGRFPQADDLDAFWHNLREGRDCVTEVPHERWSEGWLDTSDVDAAIENGKSYCDQGGFITGFADFDSELFGILPNTAHCMDPQERWFIQSCWLAMENAGYTPESLRRDARAGVYAGVTKTGFDLYLPELVAQGETLLPHTSFSSVANHVSYLFDFTGPSLPIDTMCSAALTAIHEACESLHRGACEVAIAGGVNLYLHPHNYVYLCRARMLAPDGRCKSFAADADGFVPGEGVGTVVLKPLARAQADGDDIRAVIIASATNHGGRTNGYTVPNPHAQQALVQQALTRAAIDPRSVTYIEAHGTGTALGDPIEVKALQMAFEARARELGVTLDGWNCAIGSVKSNIGHLEAAAGMAGLAKIVLQLRHGELVPSLHAQTTNPAIVFSGTGLSVQRHLSPWRAGVDREGCVVPLRAGLSSFGAGGANAHLIVEQYVAHDSAAASVAEPALVVLSAASQAQLTSRASALRQWIAARPATADLLARVAYTLQCGRVAMAYRCAIVAASVEELIEGLDDCIGQRRSIRVFNGQSSGQADKLSSLLSDDDIELTISAWIRKGKYRRLVEAWCYGLRVDWRQLYLSGLVPRKIELPGYAFAQRRYWLPDRLVRKPATAAPGAPGRGAAPAAGVYRDRPAVLLFAGHWLELSDAAAAGHASSTMEEDLNADKYLWLVGAHGRLDDSLLAAAFPAQRIWRLPPTAGDIAENYTVQAKQMKAALRQLLSSGRPCQLNVLLVSACADPAAGLHDEGLDVCLGGLAGLLFSASEEAPRITARCFSVPPDIDGALLARLASRAGHAAAALHFREWQGKLQYFSLLELADATHSGACAWRPGGVYLVTGGLGALGRYLIEDAMRSEPSATLVLVGRRPLDEAGLHYLARWTSGGGQVEYLQADVACAAELAVAIGRIRERHAHLHGVIHCAGQLDDGPVLRSGDAATDRVFAPKVQGLVNLDTQTAAFELDFFVCYSSIASLGNRGQADYAAANGFMNHYLQQRNAGVSTGIRHGRSLSINWPLWASDGMTVDLAGEQKLQSTGMQPLEREQGLQTLQRILALRGPETDYYVFCGDAVSMRAALAARFVGLGDARTAAGVGSARGNVELCQMDAAGVDGIAARLAAVFASQTGMRQGEVDPHRRLEEYGIDSVVIAALNRSLAAHFPSLSKTLFYQFQTLQEAAWHMLRTHPHDCARWQLPLATAGGTGSGTLVSRDSLAAQTAGDGIVPAQPGGEAVASRDPQYSVARRKIAIIGLAGRYPGAATLEQFWDNLAGGKECIRPVPQDRWSLQGFYEPEIETAIAAGKSYSQWGGFIEGFDFFDYLFFGMAPVEVQCMDPQERLFIQCCWHAIEDAGYTPSTLAKRHGGGVGVFAGITKTGFDLYGPDLWRQGDMLFPYTSFSSVANRISYLFDLRGPSMPVDTMCSSSLTAVHQAVEAIRRGECDAAIAGGVNLYLHPSTYVGLSARKMLSADGRCRSFGAGSNGFVPGEGVGAVLLKGLDDAERDGDPIHALVAGSAINHGGRTHGYTVPSPTAQAAVVAGAIRDAGLHAEQIDYVEAHGTGTELGDPIEVTGLTEGFGQVARALPLRQAICALGSVKPNIGHLEAAAGIAGLTKIVLQIKHRQWVPGLHIEEANPNIGFDQSPFRLQKTLADWPAGGDGVRRAGLSSFGAGGANAHIVVEEYLQRSDQTPPAGKQGLPGLLLLSADSVGQLRTAASQLLAVARIQVCSDADLADFLFTLQIGRVTRSVRAIAAVGTPAELLQRLQQISTGDGPVAPGLLWQGVNAGESHPDAAELRSCLGPLLEPVNLTLLQQWLNNDGVDWSRAWCEGAGRCRARRLHLPGYVFRQDRFWIKDRLTAPESFFARSAIAGQDWSAAQAQPAETLAFIETLEARPLRESGRTAASAPAGPVLYFAANAEHRNAIAEVFARRGGVVEFALPPPDVSPDTAVADGTDVAAFFVSELSRFAATIDGPFSVVFAAPMEQPRRLQDPWLLVELLRSIRRTGRVDRLAIAAAHFPHGEATGSNAYLEGWEGLRRSLSAVLPDTAVGLFSQSVDAAPDWLSWAENLHSELSADGQQGLESVRFVAAERFVYETREVRFEPACPRLRKAGTYLITGGAGGLGRLIAAFLLREYSASVVLLGRSPENCVDLSGLRGFASDPARVLYLQADVGDAASLRQAVEHVERMHSRIDGVVHAAGMVAERSLFDMRREEFYEVLRPKVEGSLAMAEVFSTREPDFVVYMGSAAALLGDFGTGNYAFANRFMAQCALAAASPVRRTRHQAIHWPLWRDGGMGRDSATRTDSFLAASGQSALETTAALALFECTLGAQFGQFLLLHGDPPRLRARAAQAAVSQRSSPAAAEPMQPVAGSRQLSPAKTGEYRTLLQVVKRHIGEIVGVPPERIAGSEQFIDLGFDSVHLARLARSISLELGIELRPTELFSHSSPRALGQFLSTRLTGDRPDLQAAAARQSDRSTPTTAHVGGQAGAMTTGSGQASTAGTPAPIAIIGMSGIFPNARDVDAMWNSLRDGICGVDEISVHRFALDGLFDPANGVGKTCSRWLGMVPGCAEFDPLFFGISPLEAEEIDPRQRLLLQESWKALEQAGYGPSACARHTIGVFVGVEQGDYQQFLGTQAESTNALTTNHDAILAARLSYQLDLHGPVLTINTACSSGLVAAHQACQSLRSGECDTALAASAQLLLSPRTLVAMSQAGMLSPSGRCRAFDARADGIVAGEAVVVLVLKPLDKARADNDPVLAVIVASGINYDGRTNGITAPSGAAQRRLIEAIYRRHAIDPTHIGFVLAHGTGTRLGDPVEVNALVEAFRAFTSRRGFCAVGSTKTNFGHTFAASGLVSVAAMVKALQNALIPASLHCEQDNELVDWQASPFYVNKTAQPWGTSPMRSRLGAVSAFGMSGTNAHMVIAEAVEAAPQPAVPAGPVLLLLSARSAAALQRKIRELADYCRRRDPDQAALLRLSYTLSVCRHHFRHRCALIAGSAAEAIAKLEQAGGLAAQDVGGSCRVVRRDFEADPATLAKLNARIRQASVPALAEALSAYLQGYDLDWTQCHAGQCLTPLDAPGYPFSRKDYWIGGRNGGDPERDPHSAVSADGIWNTLLAAAQPPPGGSVQARPVPAFDMDFYTALMTKLADNELSVDDAIAHTHAQMNASFIGDARD